MWYVISLKELRDALRDRRALMALLIFPILGPLVIYFMFTRIVSIAEEVDEVVLPVVGAHYAVDLIDYLEQAGLEIEAFGESGSPAENLGETGLVKDFPAYSSELLEQIDAAIQAREHDYILLIPEDFETRIVESRSANLELHFESSRTSAMPKVQRVQQTIESWGQETAALRLLARGINPQIINPVSVQRIDVASEQARAQRVLGMIPFFVIMAAFVCGMGIAVDTTAGERERKSLEPLLVNPVSRSAIVFGKWMTAALFSALGLILVMTLNLFALSKVPLEQVGLVFNIGKVEIVGIMITTLPLAFFATSVQIFAGIFARSFKDAQSYLSLITLLPMLPYLFNMFNTQAREFWMSLVPMLGQYMLLTDVVSGKTPGIFDFMLAGIMILLYSLLFIYGAVCLFKREQIIFS